MVFRIAILAAAASLGAAAQAQTPPVDPATQSQAPQVAADPVQRIDVEGRHYENAVGTSDAASQGVIRAELLKSRPAQRPGEVLEFVPGVIVTQHSGAARPTSTSCAASTSTTAPTSPPVSTACR